MENSICMKRNSVQAYWIRQIESIVRSIIFTLFDG